MTTLIDPRHAWRAILIDDAAVAALIGERIYHSVLPQKPTVPAVSYTEVSALGDHHARGPSGLAQCRVQFNCWGATASEAYGLGLAVKAALDGFGSGEVSYGSDSPPGTVTIRGIFFTSSQDLYDDEAKLHYRALDFIIWYAEF